MSRMTAPADFEFIVEGFEEKREEPVIEECLRCWRSMRGILLNRPLPCSLRGDQTVCWQASAGTCYRMFADLLII